MDDHVLLREYVEHQSEQAFAELVERHLPFVYATALRLARDPHTAQDIAQAVFIQLARKAGAVRNGNALPGWLYRATHYAALVVFRRESRRRQRETAAMNLAEQNSSSDGAWTQIAPLLDEALGRLDQSDQDAVLLRFFHEKSYREVGVALGLNEDAARKRVERALEDVRGYFTRHGVTTTAALLSTAMTAHAAVAPPSVLNASVAGASLTGAASSGAAHLGWQILFMSTRAKIITTALIVAIIAAIPITIQWQKINDLSGQLAQSGNAPKTATRASVPVAAVVPALPAAVPQVAAPVAPTATPAQLAAVNQAANAQARNAAITNNLRLIGAGAQQYMLDQGVTEVTYDELIGNNPKGVRYIRDISIVRGEDYSGIVVHQADTQISIVSADGSVITYSM